MGAIDVSFDKPTASDAVASVGWFLGALGLAGISWWVWTWSKVETLINDHVQEHGQLPTSPMERAALYSDGTAAEQRLSADLEAIAGLYPWGSAPLILAGLVALGGFALALRQSRFLAGIGLVVTVVLMAVWSTALGDATTVALDILE